MSDFQLGNVTMLWMLWTVPGLIVFYAYVFRRKAMLMRRFVSLPMFAKLASDVSRQRQVLKAGMVTLGLLFALLALAQIRWGFTWEEIERRGVDIVLALDVSESMLVEDAQIGGKLTRLERAKREISDLLQMLEGDRIALIAFAGTAFIECPLTLDYAAAEVFLDSLDTNLIPVKGTAIGDALDESLKALDKSATASKAVILITDGEDHSGEALAMAEQAKIQGVRIFTIGIGRDEGAPIPKPGGGFKRDRTGNMVLSKLDETTLQKIALTTGGRYVRSVTGDVDLEQIYTQGIKATLEDQELGSKRRQRFKDRFQWLLGLSVFFLTIETFIGERRRSTQGAKS